MPRTNRKEEQLELPLPPPEPTKNVVKNDGACVLFTLTLEEADRLVEALRVADIAMMHYAMSLPFSGAKTNENREELMKWKNLINDQLVCLIANQKKSKNK